MIQSVAGGVLALAACGEGPGNQIDAPLAVTLDCTTYCNEIQTNCTGLNAQFPRWRSAWPRV